MIAGHRLRSFIPPSRNLPLISLTSFEYIVYSFLYEQKTCLQTTEKKNEQVPYLRFVYLAVVTSVGTMS